MNKKRYVVSWWSGETIVDAETPEQARDLVKGVNADYIRYGRRAPLFVKEVA